MVCDLSYIEEWEEKAHGLTESISDKGVYRTASATPGPLIICMLSNKTSHYLSLHD